MSEERKMILEMLNNGDINVEEAERLLSAIPEDNAQNNLAQASSEPGIQPSRIIISVTDNITSKKKVNIRMPFSLLKAGLKLGKASMALGAKYGNDIENQQIMNLIKEIDIDEILSSLNDGEITLPYTMIDIDDMENGKNDHIMIVLE